MSNWIFFFVPETVLILKKCIIPRCISCTHVIFSIESIRFIFPIATQRSLKMVAQEFTVDLDKPLVFQVQLHRHFFYNLIIYGSCICEAKYVLLNFAFLSYFPPS